jgi:hypothetical protein
MGKARRRHRRSQSSKQEQPSTALSSGAQAPSSLRPRPLRLAWAAFLAFCTITSLVAFWPRASVSMASSPGDSRWLYTFTNNSLLALHSVSGDCAIREIRVPYTGGRGSIEHFQELVPQGVTFLSAEDQHTFRCPSFSGDSPIGEFGGRVEVRVSYRYLGIRHNADACFELEPVGEKSRVWLRQACPANMNFAAMNEIRIVQAGAPQPASQSGSQTTTTH